MWLIVFTILILVGVVNVDKLWGVVVFLLNIIYPFLLGSAIAFIINMPMRFIERNLFSEAVRNIRRR